MPLPGGEALGHLHPGPREYMGAPSLGGEALHCQTLLDETTRRDLGGSLLCSPPSNLHLIHPFLLPGPVPSGHLPPCFPQ